MKKVSKLLSVVLAGIMLLSAFTVSASAKTMSKTEIVDFYHSILEKTAEKNRMILAKNDYKSVDKADFSGISGLDLLLTKNMYSACDGEWYEYTSEELFSGVIDSEDDATDSDFYFVFSVDIDPEYGTTLKKASYKDNKIVIEIETEYDDEIISVKGTEKITAELGKGNVLQKLTRETYNTYNEESVIKGTHFTTTHESVDVYTFTYEKVPVKSLTLSETNITLGYGEVAQIEYTVGPENATIKNIDVYAALNEDGEIIAEAYEDEGRITVIGLTEGTGTVEVYTVSGDILATCEVTVEFNFIERILAKFQYFFVWFFIFFGENIDLV